jgi:succinyl-diaminopimelate desuccinylase
MLAAMAAIQRRGWRPKGDVRLAVTIGEEVDCVGEAPARPQWKGLADVSARPPDVVAAHRGAIWLEIVGAQQDRHGSTPHPVNAIDHVTLLGWLAQRWPKYPFTPHDLLAPPTMNLGTLSGGIKTNVVPTAAWRQWTCGRCPGQDPGDRAGDPGWPPS